MRDEERIDRILDKLKKVWKDGGNKDMRLGQLMINYCGQEDSNQNWHMEDDLLEEHLDLYIAIEIKGEK